MERANNILTFSRRPAKEIKEYLKGDLAKMADAENIIVIWQKKDEEDNWHTSIDYSTDDLPLLHYGMCSAITSLMRLGVLIDS